MRIKRQRWVEILKGRENMGERRERENMRERKKSRVTLEK
jgi:hypothetical protein